MKTRYDKWKAPLAVLALGLAAGPVSAQKIYSWTNDAGEIVYGNSPPPEVAEQIFDRRFPVESMEDDAAAKQAQEDRILLQTLQQRGQAI